jgi:hypothetical protein
MEIPIIGTVTKDEELGWYYSEPIPVQVLGGQRCRFILSGYDDDANKDDFHTAIKNFLSINESVLHDAEPHIFQYYQDFNADWEADDEEFITIESPADVWRHIQLGAKPMVTRRGYGDQGIYISLDCECDWEVEHGLEIVFKNGLRINKIGQFNSHCTNSDAYDDESLEDVIYVQI